MISRSDRGRGAKIRNAIRQKLLAVEHSRHGVTTSVSVKDAHVIGLVAQLSPSSGIKSRQTLLLHKNDACYLRSTDIPVFVYRDADCYLVALQRPCFRQPAYRQPVYSPHASGTCCSPPALFNIGSRRGKQHRRLDHQQWQDSEGRLL